MTGLPVQVREVYRLLVDSSAPIRHAAAELVAGMLEEQGRRFMAQVTCAVVMLRFRTPDDDPITCQDSCMPHVSWPQLGPLLLCTTAQRLVKGQS